MSKGKYILVNGSFVPTEEYRISLPEAESIHFSEKVRSIRSAFPFLWETLEVIKLKLLIFNQSFPEFMNNDGSELKRQLERTLTKNKHFLGAVLILTFRFTDHQVHYTIQSEKLDSTGYELNEKGLYVRIFDEIQKSASSLSHLSIGSEIYWKVAQNRSENSMVDQLLLSNSEDQIIEIPESNIYLVKGKTIRGAGIEQGAYMDITRPLMLTIFERLNLKYSEDEGITNKDIQEAEEILAVNAIEGIRWIVGFEGKRYFNHTIRKISEMFNQSILN
ncbi:MAG: aminotransferase class IV [Bacteroidota bacterium]|nr:aminotransferase class IV [Bacteroidota bacterium]